MANPAFISAENEAIEVAPNYADDNWLQLGSIDKAMLAQPIGLVVQQLKIITLLLREGFGINVSDEDLTLLAQVPQTIIPPATNNSI